MKINFRDLMEITVDDRGEALLTGFCGVKNDGKAMKLIELQLSGENWNEHHNNKYFGTCSGGELRYVSHTVTEGEQGGELTVLLRSGKLEAKMSFVCYGGMELLRCRTELTNIGRETAEIEYVSSFCFGALGGPNWQENGSLYVPHNTWCGELQWRKYRVSDLGVNDLGCNGLKRIYAASNGTWSTGEYLPMGMYENEGGVTFWQIENNGAWYWEISDMDKELYLRLSGPTERENHWHKSLKPGESFRTVPVCVGRAGSFEAAVGELTRYRRGIRRKNSDNEKLPVIFNDYMNCLSGDPTTEKLFPLIDAAAEAGCEYFCIDAGWYADGAWWDEVGEWLPSKRRFPGGITEVTQRIKEKGMKLGLWLEIEVVGIHSPILKKAKPDWFFTRHGKAVIDHGRYQLDFRNPEVRAFADEIVHRLVNEYGAEYIKMDYNINAGIGTELQSDSLGDGLLEHNRAYLKWLDAVFERYPSLVIENCSSGGMRMDYAMLSRYSIQSTSDQVDYKRYAMIAANVASGCCPEQAAVWSYPLSSGDEEETVFNMVNAMLCRIHQSGHLANLSNERFELVKEGISVYKGIREHIKNGLPFYPMGIAMDYLQKSYACGLDCGERRFMAVWQMDSREDIVLNIGAKEIKQIYPVSMPVPAALENGVLTLKMKPFTARLFEIK